MSEFVDDPEAGLEEAKRRLRESMGDFLVEMAQFVKRSGVQGPAINRLAGVVRGMQDLRAQLDVPEPEFSPVLLEAPKADRETEGVQAMRSVLSTMTTLSKPKALGQLTMVREHYTEQAKSRALTPEELETVARVDEKIREQAEALVQADAKIEAMIEDTSSKVGKLLASEEKRIQTLIDGQALAEAPVAEWV